MADSKNICCIFLILLTILLHIASMVFFIYGFILNNWFYCDFGADHPDVRINILNVCEGDACESHAEKSRKIFT